MFEYVIHWQDRTRAPESILADRFENEGEDYVFYSTTVGGIEQRRVIPQSEVDIVTLEGQLGV